MLESGITTRGQTTIPRAVREALALAPGDRVRYLILDGEVRIIKMGSIDRLFGVLSHKGPTVSLEDMERAIAAGASET